MQDQDFHEQNSTLIDNADKKQAFMKQYEGDESMQPKWDSAEIENQRRRFEKEIKDAFEFGSFNFAKESLAILDNLERAKTAIKNDEVLKSNKDLNKFLENISIIEKDLISIFERNRITKIEAKGKKFDPNLHQAMVEIEDNQSEPGKIVQEIQSGYMLGERLLRPALVGVSKKKSSKNDEKSEKKDKK